jgi:hypothetical protein
MKTAGATIENPIRLAGRMTWIYYEGGSDSTPVERALIRGERDLVVEAKWDGYCYTVPLRSADGVTFAADVQCKTANKIWDLRIECKLWSNKSGFLLFGKWIEGGDETYRVVELTTDTKL